MFLGPQGQLTRIAHSDAYSKKTPFPMPVSAKPVVVLPVFKTPPPDPAIDFEVDVPRGDKAAPPQPLVRVPVVVPPPPSPRPLIKLPFRGTTEHREQYPRKESPRRQPRAGDECLAASVPRPYKAAPKVRAAFCSGSEA